MVKIKKHDFGDEVIYDIVVGLDYELESCPADLFDRIFYDLTEKDLLELKKELDKLNLT